MPSKVVNEEGPSRRLKDDPGRFEQIKGSGCTVVTKHFQDTAQVDVIDIRSVRLLATSQAGGLRSEASNVTRSVLPSSK